MLLSAYVRYVFLCRPGFNLRTSEMFSGVDQVIKAWPITENISDVRRLKPVLLQKTSLTYADESLVYSRKHL
jgi:hypothetical protein